VEPRRAAVPSDWLYPLSSSSTYWFEYAGGTTPDTSPTSFEEMIQNGAADDEWGAYKNWRNIQPGDRMWAYYGAADGDLGVVGLAAVTEVVPPVKSRGRAAIFLLWDRDATLRLLRNPFPAVQVRQVIARPQGAAWAVPARLATKLSRHADAPGASKKPASSARYGSAVESTISYTPPTSVKVSRRHDAILRPFERRMITAGWTSTDLKLGSKRADLVMRRDRELAIIEAKTISGSTNDAVRAAFAQLAEYAWLHQQTAPKELPATRWALFEREPSSEEIRFLEDHGVRVTWASRTRHRLFHGPATATTAAQQGL
jgi:hypothetical protein